MTLPQTDLARRRTVRLIPSGRLKEPVLAPLAEGADDLAALARLESATNERLLANHSGLSDLDPRELAFARPGHSWINAAFIHTRPGGSRFNDEDRGAWYCAFEIETALAEVAFHLTRELAAIGCYENTTDYAELFADFVGPFHDLRAAGAVPYLDADIAKGYPAGQALARELRRSHASNGVIYPSLRHAGGLCLAAFRPSVVQNVQQGGLWRLQWQGAPEPTIIAIADPVAG